MPVSQAPPFLFVTHYYCCIFTIGGTAEKGKLGTAAVDISPDCLNLDYMNLMRKSPDIGGFSINRQIRTFRTAATGRLRGNL
jgi:hypothetical protein